MTRTCLSLLAVLAVAACGPGEPNPPTEPAEPVDTPEAAVDPALQPPGPGGGLPGTGPRNFVGRWAADVSWCPNRTGPERPIEITTTRFEGYENSCAVASISQVADGYEALLTCTAEGAVANERVRMNVTGQSLRLTWLNRDNAAVNLTKCTTLEDTPGG
ncbi:hypothetical protein GCM10009116_02170 [Brevundimonas basaltis]|uniref:Ig-like domain-containing protein n=1 Tax=Brevundimonas basaltis TaxID=472166 RepID=A0A7W8HZ08_9CAUL|nr:hypothetical protein [Brevundimonas basaltis]MBB5292488.1 hypothetical protein [Brevundimonas basaltis]